MDNKIKNWIKLDNAAIIYPTTLSKDYAVMFRLTVKFKEEIDKEILKKAIQNVMGRFPTFSFKLERGFFWFYLKEIQGLPELGEDFNNPMYRINFKKNKNFMFRIRYFENRLAVEFFHALTDGSGGLCFILTLSAEYLKLKYNIEINYSDLVLNPNDEPKEEEYVDNFRKFARGVGAEFKENSAYHYSGSLLEKHMLKIITGKVDIQPLKSECKKYDCTINDFLCALMIYSLQIMQMRDVIKQKNRKEIKISVPVNLRKVYKVNSMRNFASYVNVGIKPKLGVYSLPEIICEVKNQMKLGINEKNLNAKISANTNLENNFFIRRIPLFIKSPIISMIQNNVGDNYITQTLSNLGYVKLDDNMEKYIDELGFILGKAKNSPGRCACVGYKDKIYISFSRKIKETDFERIFFTELVKLNIPVEIESNEG